MTDSGWVKFHRALLRHPLVTQCSPVTFRVWVLILLRANWQPYTALMEGGIQETMPAGSFLFSQRKLAAEFGCSHQCLRDSLETLEKRTQCITLRRTQSGTCLIVTNWERYQSDDERENTAENTAENTRVTQKEHRTNTEGTLEEEYKKLRREEVKTKPSPSATAWRVAKFAAFWKIVWAKIARTTAEKAWDKLVTSEALADRIIAAAIEQGPGLLEHARTNGHSVLHPATWLNAGRWEDEPDSLMFDLVSHQSPMSEFERDRREEVRQAELRLSRGEIQ